MLVGHATIAAGSMDHRAVRPEPAFATDFWKDAAARKSWDDLICAGRGWTIRPR
jgi:hypothetical protein